MSDVMPCVKQLPPTAKHPDARLIPPVDENVDVAVEKLMPFVVPMARREPGVVVPMPTLPLLNTTISLAPLDEATLNGLTFAAALISKVAAGDAWPSPSLPSSCNVIFVVPPALKYI